MELLALAPKMDGDHSRWIEDATHILEADRLAPVQGDALELRAMEFVRKQAARQPYSTSSGEAGDSWSSCSGCHQDYEGPHDADCPVAGAQAVLGCNCNQEDATEECPLHGAATQPPAPPVGTGGTTP